MARRRHSREVRATFGKSPVKPHQALGTATCPYGRTRLTWSPMSWMGLSFSGGKIRELEQKF